MKMLGTLFTAALVVPALAGAQSVPSAESQIAAAVMAAPEERRAEAAVLGFDESGTLVTLREGSNDLVCLADTPGNEEFEVACYHEDLEPYMTRGRELSAQGVTGQERYDIRWQEIEAGTLAMAREPRTLYVLSGDGFDAAANAVTNPYQRWVLYWPFATEEQTGLSTQPAPGKPWLMYAGTAGAHVMISPPRQRPPASQP